MTIGGYMISFYTNHLKKIINNIKSKVFRALFTKSVTIESSNDLNGHVIIITGASRGIGKATAEILYNEGASLVLISRHLSNLEKAFLDFDRERTLLLAGDVTQENDANKIIKETMNKFGKVDVLINNAGIFIEKPIEETSLEEFEALMGTNVKGPFLMSKAAIPEMKKKKDGLILNIGSKISHNTNILPNRVLYATSKYAIEGMSNALNRELKKSGIRTTCLMPGPVINYFSLEGKDFLSPYSIGQVISTIIKYKDVDFENFVIMSKKQDKIR